MLRPACRHGPCAIEYGLGGKVAELVLFLADGGSSRSGFIAGLVRVALV